MYSIVIQELVKSNVTFNQEYKMKGTLVFLHLYSLISRLTSPLNHLGTSSVLLSNLQP